MTWLEAARRVVEKSGYEVINPDTCEPVETKWIDEPPEGEQLVAVNGDGVLLDAFTAQHMLVLHEHLGPEARAKFEAMPLMKAVNVTWKMFEKFGSRA